ncbi:MAG TPA: hypothetical protein PLL30_14185 [Candidatus Krumholzibacteria bacterium]|nr:hypothetical protein [Candidatus Krumholzibacteria bacterium]HPD72915.1 hypothetical protein [Candidatus Krumholzibacteria bacterium]HRY41714.1 hypothetical protein [Candidatus Krumholzibacteria bacterium]
MRNGKMVLGILAGLLILALSGCADAPAEKIQATQAALDSAKAAAAEKYASASWMQAQDMMNQAQAELQAQEKKLGLFRSYGKSEELLAAAQLQAEKAAQEAVAAKEAARQATVSALEAARTELQATVDLLATAPRGKDTKAEIESMQQELASLATVLDQAATLVPAEDFDGARAQIEQVNAKVAEIKADVMAAIAKVKR